jgi:hypothetical protein
MHDASTRSPVPLTLVPALKRSEIDAIAGDIDFLARF